MSNHDSESNKDDQEHLEQHVHDLDDEDIPQANEDDFIYLDDEMIEAMDHQNIGVDDDPDEFQTINESDVEDG
jgi:hypothetical protein